MKPLASLKQPANPVLIFWIAIGLVGFFAVPWYGVEDFFKFEWCVDLTITGFRSFAATESWEFFHPLLLINFLSMNKNQARPLHVSY